MPELKSYIVVTNHNQSLSKKIFDHAIKLGYVDSLGIGDGRTTRQFVDVSAFSIQSHRIGWWGIYDGEGWYDCIQISPDEFLKIGEDIPLKERLQSCKINLSGLSVTEMREVSLVLEKNEISGYNSEFIIRHPQWNENYYNKDGLDYDTPYGLYIVDGETVMVGTQLYFDSLPQPEIKVEELLKTKNKVMLKLNLEKQPQKAKNLTVGREYEGIYVDEDNNQVDSFDDADYFLCVNNAGKEARYSIALFSKPAPALPTFRKVLEGIEYDFDEEEVKIGNIVITDCGLSLDDVNCSCGVSSFNEINKVFSNILEELERVNAVDIVCDTENWDNELLASVAFKKVVLTELEKDNSAFGIFSTTTNHPCVPIMDSLAAEYGVVTESKLNPNSRNQIKVWVLTKPE